MDPQVPEAPAPSKNDSALQAQTQAITHHQVTTPKSSQGVFELPCGYLDGAGTLHTEIAVKEITGSEEDLLASKMPSHLKINEMLTRCVTRLGNLSARGDITNAVLDLTVGDRAFLMFAIRRISLGDEYPFKDVCPECEAEKIYTVDLSTLEPKKMPDPKKRSFEVVLPGSQKVAKFHPMTGRDENKLAKFDKNKADTMSLAILMRLDGLDGKVPTIVEVKNLGLSDRNYLRDQFEDNEGGLDTEIELQCPDCAHDFKRDVDVSQQSFFFPSAMLKSLKRKSST